MAPAEAAANGIFSPPARGAGHAADGPWRLEDAVPQVPDLRGLALESWRHEALGTRAVLAKVEGPLCGVSMFFATEAHDDKGLPHCLEHLCFMGSQGYRRGHLDLLATRCGSDGTNAYTESDHTCYSFEVVGEAGLLTILPVFVDHVLCPLLTEDAFVTEIFHINGKGERQGVVYSEMLGRITDEPDVMDLAVRRATFGDASPYSFEHGGMPDCIMKLTREEVAKYHKQVYTTDNLHVVVTGSFDDAKVRQALDSALEAAVRQGASRRCRQRPFTEPLPGLPEASELRRTVTFPTSDVSVGSVAYSRRLEGVSVADTRQMAALDCLGRYLTGLASSPLEQAFVQCNPPVASGVTMEVNPTAVPHLTIEFTGVPFVASAKEEAASRKLGGGDEDEDDDAEEDAQKDSADGDDAGEGSGEGDEEEEDDDEGPDWFHEDAMLDRFVGVMQKVCDALRQGDEGTLAELQRAVNKERVSRQEEFEDGPIEFLSQNLCSSLIFDHYPSAGAEADATAAAPRVLESIPARSTALRELGAMGASWWAELLERHVLRPLVATREGKAGGMAEVRCCPSALMSLQNERREEKAAKQNVKKLGKQKLKALQERVDKAEEANAVHVSDEQRSAFPSPALFSAAPDLPWDMVLSPPPDGGGLEVLQVEEPSGFVELRLIWRLDDEALAGSRGAQLRRYLLMFSELLCETDVAGEGYRTVVARLDDELVSYHACIGCNSDFMRVGTHPFWLTLLLSCEPERVTELVSWADMLVHECDFSEEKVLATCTNLSTELKESMREGRGVLGQVVPAALYDPLSPQVQLGALSQASFLERCCKDLGATCEALRELRDAIAAPRVAVAAVVSASAASCRQGVVERLQQAWCRRHAARRPAVFQDIVWGAGSSPSAQPLMPFRQAVIGCAGSDTAEVQLRADLPTSRLSLRESWAIRLLCEALSMMEGPLCMAVRGKGLAYGARVAYYAYENAVGLEIWECTNVRKALEGALAVVRDALTGDVLSDFQLDNARGSLVFQAKGRRATPTHVVDDAIASSSRGLRSAAAVHERENELGSVTREDVEAVHRKYLTKLCDLAEVHAFVVCDPGECKAKAKGLASCLGIDVGKVFVQEKIKECFGLVDGRIAAACGSKGSGS